MGTAARCLSSGVGCTYTCVCSVYLEGVHATCM